MMLTLLLLLLLKMMIGLITLTIRSYASNVCRLCSFV